MYKNWYGIWSYHNNQHDVVQKSKTNAFFQLTLQICWFLVEKREENDFMRQDLEHARVLKRVS